MAKRQSRKEKRRDETSVATGGFIDPYMSPQEKQRMKLLARRQGRHPEGRRHSKRHASRLEGFMNFMKEDPPQPPSYDIFSTHWKDDPNLNPRASDVPRRPRNATVPHQNYTRSRNIDPEYGSQSLTNRLRVGGITRRTPRGTPGLQEGDENAYQRTIGDRVQGINREFRETLPPRQYMSEEGLAATSAHAAALGEEQHLADKLLHFYPDPAEAMRQRDADMSPEWKDWYDAAPGGGGGSNYPLKAPGDFRTPYDFYTKPHASSPHQFKMEKQGPGEGAGAYSGTRDTPTTSMSSLRRLQSQSEERGAKPWKYWKDNQPTKPSYIRSKDDSPPNDYWNPPDEKGMQMPSGAVWSTDDWKRGDKNLVTRGLDEGAEAANRGIKNFDLGSTLEWLSRYPATQKLQKEFTRAEEILNEERF